MKHLILLTIFGSVSALSVDLSCIVPCEYIGCYTMEDSSEKFVMAEDPLEMTEIYSSNER